MNDNTATDSLLAPGTSVVYRSNSGGTKRSVVEYADDDIKNGRAGYDLADGSWCYADQIVRVIK